MMHKCFFCIRSLIGGWYLLVYSYSFNLLTYLLTYLFYLLIQHNKPDLVIWNTKGKTCNIIESSCPADINITRKEEENCRLTYR